MKKQKILLMIINQLFFHLIGVFGFAIEHSLKFQKIGPLKTGCGIFTMKGLVKIGTHSASLVIAPESEGSTEFVFNQNNLPSVTPLDGKIVTARVILSNANKNEIDLVDSKSIRTEINHIRQSLKFGNLIRLERKIPCK